MAGTPENGCRGRFISLYTGSYHLWLFGAVFIKKKKKISESFGYLQLFLREEMHQLREGNYSSNNFMACFYCHCFMMVMFQRLSTDPTNTTKLVVPVLKPQHRHASKSAFCHHLCGYVSKLVLNSGKFRFLALPVLHTD